MKIFSFTTLITVLTIAYLGQTIWVLYELWFPEGCANKKHGNCLSSVLHEDAEKTWNIELYTSMKQKTSRPTKSILQIENFNFSETFTRTLDVSIPKKTKNNGSLFLHVYAYPSVGSINHGVGAMTAITGYRIPVSYIQLIGNATEKKSSTGQKAETHWRPKLTFHVMNDPFIFDRNKIPGEMMSLILLQGNMYMPILYIDELSYLTTDLERIPENANSMNLTVTYETISIGKLRFWLTMTHAMDAMKTLGFTEKDLDEVKGIFTGTNLMFLALTFVVSFFHMLFDFLAFKNDISYWKKRETMAGLSFHTVVYRAVSTIIIFLYLLDQQTSLLVLVPAGIGSVIELWKVKKAMKVSVNRIGWKLSLTFGNTTDTEKNTTNFDHQAIKYLSYVLYPLCIGGAVYSLFYVPHKSWYSWVIQSLVNAVYAFGFLFMLPQLFINYKLKSVAHLPWRAFMYKAFNTFIDDIFAFIIRMPTSHRVACFRDDIVFFCYLYQLWLYPVDKTRPNEFGISYEDETKTDDKTADNVPNQDQTSLESKKKV